VNVSAFSYFRFQFYDCNSITEINCLKICKCGLVQYLYKKSAHKGRICHNIHFPNANHIHDSDRIHIKCLSIYEAIQWNPSAVILDIGLQAVNSSPYGQRNWHLIKHQPMNFHCKELRMSLLQSLHYCSIHFFVWPQFIPLNTLVQISYTTLVTYQIFMVDCR
jgi:hypothetical protein